MEVPIVGSDAVRWTRLGISRPAPPASACISQLPVDNAAGYALIPTCNNRTRDCFIFWRFHNAMPSTMEILQLSPHQHCPAYGLRLFFDEPVCAFASIYPIEVDDGQGFYFGITVVAVSGIVYIVKLPVSNDLWSNYALPSSNLLVRDLSSDLAKLQQVTKIAAAKNMLFVGGQTGSVMCFSLFADSDISYELKGGDAGLSRLWGLVSRNKTVGSVKSLAIEETSSKTILFVLHEDGIMQGWDPLHHVRLFSHNLCSWPELAGSTALNMWLEEGSFAPSKQIALLLRKPVMGVQVICIYTLDGGPSYSIQLGPNPAIRMDEGNVVDAKLLEGGLWILKESKATAYELIHMKLQHAVLPQPFHLQEEEIFDRLIFGEGPFIDDSLSAYLEAPSLSKLFLRRLLEPGTFHQGTLQEVLRNRGQSISDADCKKLSISDWQKRIISSVDTDMASDNFERLRRWNGLASDYFNVWKKRNIPCVLFSDTRTGCMGIMRTSSMSLLRLQSSVEKSRYVLDNDGKGDIFNDLLKCMREATSHLGKLPLAILHESLLNPKGSSLDTLLSQYLHILDVGHQASSRRSHNLGVDDFRLQERQYHREHRLFNFRIFSALQSIRSNSGSWGNVIDSVLVHAKDIHEFGMHFPAQKMPSVSSSGFTKLLGKSTSQVLQAHFEASRDLVLLMSFLVNVKGQIGLTGDDIARIQQKVLPQLKKAMVMNLILHLLTVTYGETPYSDDFSSMLSSLRLDGSKVGTIWTSSEHFTLMEVLVSSFLDAAPTTFSQFEGALIDKGDFLDYTRVFITWLLFGQDPRRPQFSQRVLSLSNILLHQGQYGGLEEFLSVVDKFSNERHLHSTTNAVAESSARLYLLGLCLLARACSGMEGQDKLQQISEASTYFFRAAAGLAELGEANEIFQPLLPRSGSQTDAAGKLQYFQWVMQIFEQHNLSEGAMEFALAALDQVDDNDMDNVSVKGRLWANVFKFAMDLELYGDAYCAIISNPDVEAKQTCLRRFVVVLCERKETKILCGGELPYVGLLETVEQELAWKAEYSDISTKPNAYKLLYAFHVQRHNYRRSAGYMYRYATRMKEEGVSKSRLEISVAFQEHLNGLAATINALSLVSPEYAWLDGQFTGFDEFTWSSPSKRGRSAAGTQARKHVKITEAHIVDIEELEKQYAIAVAKLELVKARVNHPKLGELLPAEVTHLLVHSGLHDIAFSTVFRLYKDSLLKSELEKVFGLMASQCCTPLAVIPNQRLLLSANFAEPNGTKATWQALQSNLEKYRSLHPRLPVLVAEAILSANRHMELPVWLVDMFKGGRCASSLGMAGEEGDPAALLRIYVDNGRFVEAAFLLLDYFKASANMGPMDVIKRKMMSSTWFPYTSITRLQAALAEARDKDPQIEDLEKSVNTALQSHLDQMKLDTEDVASLMQADSHDHMSI